MKILIGALLFFGFLLPGQSDAADFQISFKWLKTSTCTGGYPDTEKNPRFELKNVPSGTTVIHCEGKRRRREYFGKSKSKTQISRMKKYFPNGQNNFLYNDSSLNTLF